MAIRVKHKVAVSIGLDTAMKDTLLVTDDTLAEVILDGFERGVSNVISVPATTTEELSLGDLSTVRGMYLKVSGDCKVYLNDSADAIELKAGASTVDAKMFIEATITKVEVEALSDVLTGVYALWGDPTA